jgi:hypothetical protein
MQYLDEAGWHFARSDADGWVSVNYTGENGAWLAWMQDRGSYLVAYAVCPTKAPVGRRPAIAEFITRANFGLAAGNFEMNFDTGQIRFKNGIYARDEALSASLVGRMFQFANWTMDDYYAGLMAVIYAGSDPATAVAQMEEAVQRRRQTTTAATATATEVEDVDGEPAPPVELHNAEIQSLLTRLTEQMEQDELSAGEDAGA